MDSKGGNLPKNVAELEQKQGVEQLDDETIYTPQDEKFKDSRPWRNDPSYFTQAKISLVACIKMLYHASLAGDYEVMGYCRGKTTPQTVWLIDSFEVPAKATFTNVIHTAACDTYLYSEITGGDKLDRLENPVAWYHSHPSYHPFLSGLDVTTQRMQQMANNFSAVVIDPISSQAAGKIDIGVFRTWPSKEQNGGKEYIKNEKDKKMANISEGNITEDKIKEFGIHANEYYALEVSFFKNSIDTQLIQQLWNKYWINTVTQDSLYQNNEYFVHCITDLSKKANAQNKGKKSSDKFVKAEDLIGDNQKQQYNRYLATALEKNQAIIGEAVKNLLFSYKV